MIWEWACWVPRLVNLRGLLQVDERFPDQAPGLPPIRLDFTASSSIPPIMLVCREAYSISSHIYTRADTIIPDWHDTGYLTTHTSPSMFFNLHSDTLYLALDNSGHKRSTCYTEIHEPPAEILKDDLQSLQVEKVALSVGFF